MQTIGIDLCVKMIILSSFIFVGFDKFNININEFHFQVIDIGFYRLVQWLQRNREYYCQCHIE